MLGQTTLCMAGTSPQMGVALCLCPEPCCRREPSLHHGSSEVSYSQGIRAISSPSSLPSLYMVLIMYKDKKD